MDKLRPEYQAKWGSNPLYSRDVLLDIGQEVQLHTELENVLSSAGSCLNVLGNLNYHRQDMASFLNRFGLEIQEVIEFPINADVGGEIYDDKGYAVFEWIGPKKSPINEKGGKRGMNRTSIDAFVLAVIEGRLTQILVEWKFTESYGSMDKLQKFAGVAGTERAKRYASVLAELRTMEQFPFNMEYEGGWGLHDLGYEPLYQLLRMTLLAKMTTPLHVAKGIEIEDYRILHLTHSENSKLNTVTGRHLSYCRGLNHLADSGIHELWSSILVPDEARKFFGGYWNNELSSISDSALQAYLSDRYA